MLQAWKKVVVSTGGNFAQHPFQEFKSLAGWHGWILQNFTHAAVPVFGNLLSLKDIFGVQISDAPQ